jgi:hypothetical protein
VRKPHDEVITKPFVPAQSHAAGDVLRIEAGSSRRTATLRAGWSAPRESQGSAVVKPAFGPVV